MHSICYVSYVYYLLTPHLKLDWLQHNCLSPLPSPNFRRNRIYQIITQDNIIWYNRTIIAAYLYSKCALVFNGTPHLISYMCATSGSPDRHDVMQQCIYSEHVMVHNDARCDSMIGWIFDLLSAWQSVSCFSVKIVEYPYKTTLNLLPQQSFGKLKNATKNTM